MDWTVVAVGALTTGAALGGQLVLVWGEARRENRARRVHQWEARRDAYLNLLNRVQQLDSVAAGAAATGKGHNEKEVVQSLVSAAVNAELMAPPSVWADMHPLVLAVQARSNATLAGVADRAQVEKRLRDTDAVTEHAWQEHRQRFLKAARRDLGIEEPLRH